MKPQNAKSAVCAILLSACLLAYAPVIAGLLRGDWPFVDDALTLFNKWHEFANVPLRRGELPLWNPHLFTGLPFFANNQTALLYPPNLIYLLLPMAWALFADAFAHTLLLGAGGYVLLRALRLGRTASLFGALVLMLGAPVSAHIGNGHFTWHAVRAWIPWELWGLLTLLRTPRTREAVRLALFVTATLAAGYPPVALLGAGMCAGLLLAWACAHRRANREFWTARLKMLSLAGVLAGTLGAAWLLPFADVSRASTHATGLAWNEATHDSADWKSFVRLLLPGFFGMNRSLSWSLRFPHEETGSVGILALALALGAPLLARRENHRLPRAVPWLWALLPLTALLALGYHTPVYAWFFKLPLVKATRVPARWLEAWYLVAALLSAFSLQALLERAGRRAPERPEALLRGLLWTALLMCGGALAWAQLSGSNDELWRMAARLGSERGGATLREATAELRSVAAFEAMLGVLWAGAALVLLRLERGKQRAFGAATAKRLGIALLCVGAAELVALFGRSARLSSPRVAAKEFSWPRALTARYKRGERWDTNGLGGGVSMNDAMRARVDVWGGYDALSSARFFELTRPMEGTLKWGAGYQSLHRGPLLRIAGVTHVLATQPDDDVLALVRRGNARLEAKSGDWTLWRLTGTLAQPWPRAYLSRDLRRAPDTAQPQLLNALAKQQFAHFPVVVAPRAFPNVTAPSSKTSNDAVLNWTHGQDTFSVRCRASAPSVLVVSEANAPAWYAWVNGHAATVEAANFHFRGVQVPRGESRVTLVYAPQAWRFGAFISLCGLAWLAGLLAAGSKTRKS